MKPTARLKHETVKVRDIIEDYRGGRVVIPEFQREYVWQKNKARPRADFDQVSDTCERAFSGVNRCFTAPRHNAASVE